MSSDGYGGGPPLDDQSRHTAMERARAAASISHDDLWLTYFALTGDAAPLEIEAYLQGLMPLPAAQQDILAEALRECVGDRQADRRRRPPDETPSA